MNTEKNSQATIIKKNESTSSNQKVCFIVAPIGADGTDVRRATQGLLDSTLRPLLEDEFNYKVVIAHEIAALGSITDQVVNYLLEAELVIADLTGLNPNVMYELAIRHCANLPVVVIANKNTKLPFDVVVERTIFYLNDMNGSVELKASLKKAINFIHKTDSVPDNPVSRAKKSESVREKLMSTANESDVNAMGYLVDRLSNIESMMSLVINNSSFNRFDDDGTVVYRRNKEKVINVNASNHLRRVFDSIKNLSDQKPSSVTFDSERGFMVVKYNANLSQADQKRIVDSLRSYEHIEYNFNNNEEGVIELYLRWMPLV